MLMGRWCRYYADERVADEKEDAMRRGQVAMPTFQRFLPQMRTPMEAVPLPKAQAVSSMAMRAFEMEDEKEQDPSGGNGMPLPWAPPPPSASSVAGTTTRQEENYRSYEKVRTACDYECEMKSLSRANAGHLL